MINLSRCFAIFCHLYDHEVDINFMGFNNVCNGSFGASLNWCQSINTAFLVSICLLIKAK